MPDSTTANPGFAPALERVMRQVLEMKQAGDVSLLVETFWDVLEELDFDFLSCALMLIDEEKDRLTSYSIWGEEILESFGPLRYQQRVSDDLRVLLAQGSLSSAPARFASAIAAWRERRVKHHAISEEEIEDLVRHNAQRYGSRMTAADYPVRAHLHVPFAQGVLTLRSGHAEADRVSTEQVEFLRRLVEILSAGYARYAEFLLAERNRAVQQVRAEIQAMQASDDIVGVMGLLWEELQQVCSEFGYMTISVRDPEENLVHLYALHSDKHRDIARRNKRSLRVDFVPGVDFHHTRIPGPVWEEHHTEFAGILQVREEEVDAYYERIQSLYGDERWPDELRLPLVSIASRFPQGRVILAHIQFGPEDADFIFTPEDLEILESFAEALGLGFTRFFDFQRLEQQNRQLRVERAIERMHSAVSRMERSGDIIEVVSLLTEQMRELMEVDFLTCSIGLIDEEADRVRLYCTVDSEIFLSLLPRGTRVCDSSVLPRLAEAEGPIVVKGVNSAFDFAYTTEPLGDSPVLEERNLPPRIIRRTEEEAMQVLEKYRRRWTGEWGVENVPRAVLRVPFSHGSIALTAQEPDHFTQQDLDLIAAFAGAISLGFTRFLDFQRLEQRNRELEVERSLDRVQNAVQDMKTSADIVPVIPLLSEELQRLDLDYLVCSISIVDRQAGRVQIYSSISHNTASYDDYIQTWQWMAPSSIQPFGAEAIERLERAEGSVRFTGVPGGESWIVNCVSAPLDSYHGRIQEIAETTIFARSDEEMQRLIPEYKQRWGLAEFPEWLCPYSVLRTPFSGGTIALTSPKRNHFTPSEGRILERFAQAFSLGFARYLDFRRLEEQNRALKAANQLKSEFLANMSHELRTPMSAVKHFSALILEGTYGEISDELRHAVAEMAQNGEGLLALIDDILELSKIEAGVLQLQLEPCVPEVCIENAVDALTHQAGKKGLILREEMQEELPPIAADERRLTQHVLVNLVKNAIKFTPAGEVRVGARAEENSVQFWVTDTGIGIAEEEQERIFDNFYQVDGSSTRQAEGVGLGLAIARKFVEMHKGRLWVESVVGEGSTFRFTVPTANQD